MEIGCWDNRKVLERYLGETASSEADALDDFGDPDFSNPSVNELHDLLDEWEELTEKLDL